MKKVQIAKVLAVSVIFICTCAAPAVVLASGFSNQVGVFKNYSNRYATDWHHERVSSRTAIVVIHGGGWWTGSRSEVRPICHALPRYNCFRPSYTLSMEAPFPAANLDLVRYIRRLHSRGYKRVIAVGVSAGGNLAAWLAAKGYVNGAVTWSAPSDLRVFDWWRRIPGWCVKRFANGHKRRASPAWHGVSVPILIIHSRKEWMPLDQAIRLRRASPRGKLVVLDGRRHAMGYFKEAMPLTRHWLRDHT